jgi:prepilin-type N-terminal cleavage/methylation domain-containing protein
MFAASAPVRRRSRVTGSPRPAGAGFTLIELLFSILIILILAALLLVAVRAVMDSARRTQCQKNQSEIGRSLRQFMNQYNGLTPGTIGPNRPDAYPAWALQNGVNEQSLIGSSGADQFRTYGPTGGWWVLTNGQIAVPANAGGGNGSMRIGMKGWDGYTGYVLAQYDFEVRRMWSCPEVQAPYVGNVLTLGGQVPNPVFRMPIQTQLLPLTNVNMTVAANPGKAVLCYDAGSGMVGPQSLAPGVTVDVTDLDDGGFAGTLLNNLAGYNATTPWGTLWMASGAGGTTIGLPANLEGPHGTYSNLLRADFSVGTLGMPPNPAALGNDADGADIVTVAPDVNGNFSAAQQTRQFTRYPLLRS